MIIIRGKYSKKKMVKHKKNGQNIVFCVVIYRNMRLSPTATVRDFCDKMGIFIQKGICKRIADASMYKKFSPLNEDELYDDVNREEDDEGELEHVAKEAGHLDATLLCYGLNHEVGTVANVGHSTKEDSTHGDGF